MSEFKIQLHHAPVDKEVLDGILDIVSKNVTSLSMTHPPANHPKFEAYRVALLLEIDAYLRMTPPHRIELVTVSFERVVVGFTLCGLPLSGASSECGIYYTVVSKPLRGKGLMTMMMKDIIARYPSLALSCDIPLVPLYEKYGFRCDSVRHHQIVMYFGNPVEDTPVLNVSNLMNHPLVMAEREKAANKFSPYDLDRADRAFAKRLQADEVKAKRFLKARK